MANLVAAVALEISFVRVVTHSAALLLGAFARDVAVLATVVALARAAEATTAARAAEAATATTTGGAVTRDVANTTAGLLLDGQDRKLT